MSCDCRTLRPIDVTVVTGTSVTFLVPEFTPFQSGVYTLLDCTCLANTTGAEYVYIQPFGGDAINVYAKGGDWLQYKRIAGLREKRIRLVYGAIPADRAHFEVIHDLPAGCLTSASTTAETAASTVAKTAAKA